MTPRRRQSDISLGVAFAGLVGCFGVVLDVHHAYSRAQARYEDGLNHIVLRPGSGAVQQLNSLAVAADHWWWWQLWWSLLTVGAAIAIAVLLVRRHAGRPAG